MKLFGPCYSLPPPFVLHNSFQKWSLIRFFPVSICPWKDKNSEDMKQKYINNNFFIDDLG